MLVLTTNMASLAPRNRMPDERSRRKVLKLATPLNSTILASVDQKRRERVGGEPEINALSAIFTRVNGRTSGINGALDSQKEL